MENKLKTGERYTLAELFSGNRRVIIPDLQRDYCWGDETNKKSTGGVGELVTDFIENLIEQFEQYDRSLPSLNIGLFYGYEAPADHIQLSDGQQRLTTLYLLLGMINKKTGEFRKYLISDYEFEQDDKEPYLNYAIRESSLYFLSDLVCKFFISNEDRVESIENADWYFADYNLDPTICSMINALQKIEKLLDDKDNDWLIKFGYRILNKLTFLYIDMGNRRNGEETFVIINTTGEPLSAAQTLKPKVINAKNDNTEINKKASMWEEMETWFWKKRSNGNDTADAGFYEFLRWVTMLDSDMESMKSILSEGQFEFPYKSISVSDLHSYWKIISFLFEKWEHADQLDRNYLSPSANSKAKGYKVIDQIDCFLLLPLIAYCKQWNVSEPNDRNLLRFYKFIHNLRRIKNVSNTINELVYDAVQMARICRDIVDLVDNEKAADISKTLLSEEEKLKLRILKNNANREKIEESFWEAQDDDKVPSHKIWSGQIMPLVKWSTDENGDFVFDSFKKYLSKFDEVFYGKCDGNIDKVRRALLTRELKGYPRVFRGSTNYSFGWQWNHWHILINDNIEEFRRFFDELLNGKTFDDMIKDFPKTDEWSDFVHHGFLLEYCEEKNIQIWNGVIFLIRKTRATTYRSVPSMLLFKYLENETWYAGWELWQWQDRVVLENKELNFVFDIWYYNNKWHIQFFHREDPNRIKRTAEELKQFIDSEWEFEDKVNRYKKTIDYDRVKDDFRNVRADLVKIIENIRICTL